MVSDYVGSDDPSCPSNLALLPDVVADWRGHVRIASVPPFSAIIVHTGEASLDGAGVSAAGIALALVMWALFCVCVGGLFCWMWRRTRLDYRLLATVCEMEHNSPGTVDPVHPKKRACLIAALEHHIPALGIKVSAGGLGNVVGLYVEHLPVDGKFVFAMVNGVDYSAFAVADFAIALDDVQIEVLTYTPEGGRVQFVALRHPIFTVRTTTEIYPDGRKVQHFLHFMSVWNRCIAYLLRHYRSTGEVQLFHALDYHAALAPVYLEAWGERPIPVALTLHNALYQGSLLQTLPDSSWDKISAILRLPDVRSAAELEGDFNMLHALVRAKATHLLPHTARCPEACVTMLLVGQVHPSPPARRGDCRGLQPVLGTSGGGDRSLQGHRRAWPPQPDARDGEADVARRRRTRGS
jgi:hypothetical protein